MRCTGELNRVLADGAVIIGTAGTSSRSRGGWWSRPARALAGPGPFGSWAPAWATPSGPAGPALVAGVLLLGDGSAGLSLMDVDTLVRHGLPVVMVSGNDGAWGLEKHPMRAL